jgi:hypothetical protein
VQVLRAAGVIYQRRLVVLSVDKLTLGKVDSTEVLHEINVSDILSVTSDILSVTSHAWQADAAKGRVRSFSFSDSRHCLPGQDNDSNDDEEKGHRFTIVYSLNDTSSESGGVRGAALVLRTSTAEECSRWVEAVNTAVFLRLDLLRREDGSCLRWCQRGAKLVLSSHKTQIALGAVILLAYGCSLFAAQVQPEEGSATQRVLKTMEYSFAVIFTVELLANLFSHSDKWFRTFFADGLNVCDLLVVVCMNWAVLLEYFSPAAQKLPALQVLRLLRVFKVVRLFRRLQSLRILINALVASLVPLMHAMGLLVLSTSVYAVIAVDFFQESEPEFFGSLAHSMLTFFQVRN